MATFISSPAREALRVFLEIWWQYLWKGSQPKIQIMSHFPPDLFICKIISITVFCLTANHTWTEEFLVPDQLPCPCKLLQSYVSYLNHVKSKINPMISIYKGKSMKSRHHPMLTRSFQWKVREGVKYIEPLDPTYKSCSFITGQASSLCATEGRLTPLPPSLHCGPGWTELPFWNWELVYEDGGNSGHGQGVHKHLLLPSRSHLIGRY